MIWWAVGLPVRLLLVAILNVLAAPRNLVRLAFRPRPRWVKVRLDGVLLERPPRRRLLRRRRGVSIAGLVELGRELARTPHTIGVLLEIDSIAGGWARLESLRAVIASWRQAGKRVVAHLSSPGNRELYVALACDEVLVDESGPVGLTGLLAESGFYGEALRRLGVDAELDRIGEYKSYAETFTRADMSPAHKEATDAILDGLERRLLAALATGRKLDDEKARALVDGGPYLAAAAKTAGLVDGVMYRDQLPVHLAIEGAIEGNVRSPADRSTSGPTWPLPKDPTTKPLAYEQMLAARPRWWWPGLRRRRGVAVLSLEGTIAPGESNDLLMTTCGAETACRALAALREDRRVAAVVLHVDSRGGSAAASDRIWREVALLGTAKPVVAYLDNVAASGGYYVAAPCAWIVAQPSTLTGSIGVVAGKIAVERLLEKLGVGTALLVRGRAAAMESFRRRYDDDGKARLRREIEGVYGQFVSKVATGRKLGEPEVEAVARGRVWTGEDAAERRLVDELGGLEAALEAARTRVTRTRVDEELPAIDVFARRAGGRLPFLGGAETLADTFTDAVAPLRALLAEGVFFWADPPDPR